jgi:hypothetical protein
MEPLHPLFAVDGTTCTNPVGTANPPGDATRATAADLGGASEAELGEQIAG